MYKLLLVTNHQAVRDAFAAVAWEDLGFKAPRTAQSVEEALASLKAYHADAVAVALPAEEDAALYQALMEQHLSRYKVDEAANRAAYPDTYFKNVH